jgi:hypothetical protein
MGMSFKLFSFFIKDNKKVLAVVETQDQKSLSDWTTMCRTSANMPEILAMDYNNSVPKFYYLATENVWFIYYSLYHYSDPE